MNKQNNKTTLVGALVILLVLALGYFAVISPIVSHALDSRDKLAVQQQNNDRSQIQLTSLKTKEANLGGVIAQSKSLAAQFPGTAEQVAVFTAINTSAVQAGATLVNISPVTPATGAKAAVVPEAAAAGSASGSEAKAAADFPVATVELAMTARGSAEQVRGFVANMEKMQYPVVVGNVAITGAADADTQEAVVSGTMYLTRTLAEPQIAGK